jgi:UDP-glucose 4-epimerase
MAVAGRALVTGGAGFIGVNLAPALAARGLTTRCFDNFTTGHAADAEAAGFDEIIEGDILDGPALTEAARDCDYVIHLAAQAGVPQSLADPYRDFELNVHGTLNALVAARDAGVRGFVLASSNAPLGEIQPPANEQMVPKPKSPYGASKLAGEAYCSAFHGSWGLPTIALRFANVYGPYSYHKGSVVASFCKRAIAGEDVIVYGDGTQTRDFVYVGDLCDGIASAVTSGAGGIVAHLGTGIETPVIDVAKVVLQEVGNSALGIEHRPIRDGDVARNCAAIGVARATFGYNPTTALADGMAKTVAWFRESGTA